jgi:hypothetical protein
LDSDEISRLLRFSRGKEKIKEIIRKYRPHIQSNKNKSKLFNLFNLFNVI